MKLFAFAFLVLLPVAVGDRAVIETAHKTTYHIRQTTITDRVFCSATAIGPQALLTASHCELPTDEVDVSHTGRAAIVGRVRDGNDHTILLLSGVHFPNYSKVVLNGVHQADDVFVFGNPGDLTDVFRRGYVASIHEPDPLAVMLGADTDATEILYDLNIWSGDSGAAVFNEQGEIIAVISYTNIQGSSDEPDKFRLAGGFALNFSQDALNKAASFATH